MAFDYTEYMRTIATALKSISHLGGNNSQKRFYRISGLGSMEEVLNNLTDPKMFPALLVNDLEMGRIADEGPANNYLEKQTHIFYVVQHAELNDFEKKQQGLSSAKRIVHQIIGKMLHDRLNDNRNIKPATGMRNLDTRSFFYQAVTGIGPNSVGYMVSFEIQPSIHEEVKYNENDWY